MARASQPISKKLPEPVPPAIEPTTTMRNFCNSIFRPSLANCFSWERPDLSVLSLVRSLSRILLYLS